MTHTPLVTVFTLTYRKFDNIFANIDSVLSQTYGNIELIISDDGSGNFPEHEIRNYIEQHKNANIRNVIVIANKENVGIVKHSNNVFKRGHGEVFVPLAQDDLFYSSDAVDRIMQRFIDQPFNVLVTSRYGVNEKGEFKRFWPHVKARSVIEKMTVREMFCALTEGRTLDFASGSVMCYNASFFREMGAFDEKYRLWEDCPFLHKCLLLGYKIDTAYDIVSIRYEQTDGISNLSSSSSIMKKDLLLYVNTDLKQTMNGYGFFHHRTILFTILNKKSKNIVWRFFLSILFFDVKVREMILCSDLYWRWGEYDAKEALKIQQKG